MQRSTLVLLALAAAVLSACATPTEPPSEQGTYKPDPPINPPAPPPGEAEVTPRAKPPEPAEPAEPAQGEKPAEPEQPAAREPDPAAAPSGVDQAAMARDIREMLMNQQAAWNSGDIEGFMTGYWRSEELVFTSGARVRRGFEETLASYQRSYGQGNMGQLYFADLEIRALDQDAAWVLGRYRLVGHEEEDQVGLFTLVLRRFTEGWLIVHDHTSVAS